MQFATTVKVEFNTHLLKGDRLAKIVSLLPSGEEIIRKFVMIFLFFCG
jgi:hypothetical protein